MSGGQCRYCGQPLTWARSSKGHGMPLDPDVNPAGNVAVTEPRMVEGIQQPRRARVLRAGEVAAPQEWTTTAHFATCQARR